MIHGPLNIKFTSMISMWSVSLSFPQRNRACAFSPYVPRAPLIHICILKYEHRSQWTKETASSEQQNVHKRRHGRHAGSSRLTQLCSFTIDKCSAPVYVISRKSGSRRREKLCASLLPYHCLSSYDVEQLHRKVKDAVFLFPPIRGYGFIWVNPLKGQSISRCLLSVVYRLKPGNSSSGGRGEIGDSV
jgi:hypothetical protein